MQPRLAPPNEEKTTRWSRRRAGVLSFVTRHRMLVVVCALVCIWLSVSALELALEHRAPHAQITSFGTALWWGIATFMTVGYGDVTPVTVVGRIAAGGLMMAGVFAIGIISAQISAYFLKQVLLEGRGSVDKSKIQDHFVVCGWKEDMQDLLLHILLINPTLKSQHIVVVANRTHDDITMLKSHPKLANVTVIIGEYFQQATLARAAPEVARKVLILADASPGADGRKPSATEADARTIMAAIALSSLAKGTVVAAEIIDSSLDQYLKLAGVAEIIYTREYSRLLIGSASSGTGLVNVLHDLIDPRSGAFITTQIIPDHFVEKSYGEFRADFESRHPSRLVIGILENTGNPHMIKEMAFRDAQKTPSIGRLIENLKTVKSLRCNNPVFHPRDDYHIPPGTAAIVLAGQTATTALHHEGDEVDTDNVAA